MAGSSEVRSSVGTVKWFSGQKGFGFVTPDDGGEDVFVHQTEIHLEGFRTLREGQRVEFRVDKRDDGRSKAVDVFILARSYNITTRRGRGRGDGYGRGGRGYGGGRGGDGVECYDCGRIGHMARDCYRPSLGGGGGGGGRGGSGGRGRARGGSGGRGGRECYNCGKEGHFARECPDDIVTV